MDSDSDEAKPEQKREKTLNELLTSTIVDIYIGSESSHWPLHERLLCYHSPFFARIFYDEKPRPPRPGANRSYGLPDEDDKTFELLVGWLYSRQVPMPKNEADIGRLLDLYLLADKLEIERLALDVVDRVADWYHASNTYPGLRRVQYIYANTSEDNAMREMMVSSIARQLATSETIPLHWATALQRNGQLALDIIRSIQKWKIEEGIIPDPRSGSRSSERGRPGGGFSVVVEETGATVDIQSPGGAGRVHHSAGKDGVSRDGQVGKEKDEKKN